jgi:hypothetical protein
MIPCIGCKAPVPDIDGPSLQYPNAASPGCYQVYGQILAREYGEYAYPDVHRLTVDCYAVQHPGDETRQTIQSVNLHLISLCLVLEYDFKPRYVTRLMGRAKRILEPDFVWLEPPESPGAITVLDVVDAASLSEHEALVNAWAQFTWEAWNSHHATIHGLVGSLIGA